MAQQGGTYSHTKRSDISDLPLRVEDPNDTENKSGTEDTQKWEVITAREAEEPTDARSNGWSSDFALYLGSGRWKTKVFGWSVKCSNEVPTRERRE
ncbi:hypothetical protein OQA88_6336 [Cercophora sp. LCS_1]